MCTIEEVSNLLQLNEGFNKEDADAAAKERERIISEMKKGECHFTFIKKDYSLRNAIGTLNEEFIDYKFVGDKETNESKTENPLVVKYFDLEKQSWRSFLVKNLYI